MPAPQSFRAGEYSLTHIGGDLDDDVEDGGQYAERPADDSADSHPFAAVVCWVGLVFGDSHKAKDDGRNGRQQSAAKGAENAADQRADGEPVLLTLWRSEGRGG